MVCYIRHYKKNDKGEWEEFEPPKEDIETKCSICGSKAFKDPYGKMGVVIIVDGFLR